MVAKWQKTSFPGIRYREHKIRKHGVNFDRYFTIYYRINGKQKEEGVGWANEGWTLTKVSILLSELKRNHLTGEGPQTLSEKRKFEQSKRDFEQEEKKRKAKALASFEQYFEKTYFPIAQINKSPESYKAEYIYFKKWINPVIGKMPFKNIRPLNIERIKKDMIDDDKAPRTIQYVFAIIRQAWNMARRDRLINIKSPTKEVSLPKIKNKRLRFLTHNEANLLLEDLKDKSLKCHNISLLSLHCGLRAKEIFQLTWGDVDFDRGIINVDGKDGKNRPAFMTEQIKKMLKTLYVSKPNALIFPDSNGKQIKRISNTFQRSVKDLGLNDGIDDSRLKVVFHTLRHTYASWLVEDGTDLYVVKELLGHSTIAMTERYAHLGNHKLQAAVRSLEKSMENNKGDKIIKLQEEIF